MPIGRGDAPEFAHQLFGVGDVFERMDGDGQVNGRVGQRHFQRVAEHRTGRALARPGRGALPFGHESEDPLSRLQRKTQIGCRKAQPQDATSLEVAGQFHHLLAHQRPRQAPERGFVETDEAGDIAGHGRTVPKARELVQSEVVIGGPAP